MCWLLFVLAAFGSAATPQNMARWGSLHDIAESRCLNAKKIISLINSERHTDLSWREQISRNFISGRLIIRKLDSCWQWLRFLEVYEPLAWPGRKQATATKLGIYSTYSPRSSIHFLARCSNFCKPLKKKNQVVVRPTRSPRRQWPQRRTKNGDL